MNRLLKTAALGALFGAIIGAFDAALLMWAEAGVRLLNPAIEVLQLLVTYGFIGALLAVAAGLVFRRLEARTAAALGGTGFAFIVGFVWLHIRILRQMPFYGAESMMANVGLLVGLIGLLFLFRALGNSQRGVGVAFVLMLVPAAVPFTRAVQLDDQPQALAREDLPNVTFLLLDTLRADRLSSYGYERPDGKLTSPVLDALAARGTRFEWAYASAPWTRPSVASIFTGLYSTSHQAFLPGRALPDWTLTMAEVFHRLGYLTGGFSANANISAVWGFGQGFQEFWCLDDKELVDIVTIADVEGRIRRLMERPFGTTDHATLVNSVVEPFLERASGQGRPVFTYVQYMDPHFPYDPPEDLINAESPDFSSLLSLAEGLILQPPPYPFGERPIPPAEVQQGMLELYDAEINFLDREIGKMIENLEEAGLFGGPNDYLIITSDHGEEFFEHLQWGHGQNLYQEVVRVPLIVLGPDVPAGQVIETPVSLVDLVPTLADVLDVEEWLSEGIRQEDDNGNPIGLALPGKSLVPLWTNGDEPELREVYVEKLREPVHLSLRRGNYRMIQVENTEMKDPTDPSGSEPLRHRSFYNVGDDPEEMRGYLDPEMADIPVLERVQDRFVLVPEELFDELEDLMARMPVKTTNAAAISYGAESKPLSRSDIEKMIELGYLTPEQGAEQLRNLGGD